VVDVKVGLSQQVPGGTRKNCVEFEFLTAASMRMAVFWVAASCSLVDIGVSEVLSTSIITHRPDDGGSKHL
jgi:hypothetical protein